MTQQPTEQPPAFAPPRETNGMAIASLVLGIVGFWPLALVFGYVGKGQIDRSGGREGGRGLAIAGIVLGYVGLAFTILVILFLVLAFAAGGASDADFSY